MDDYTRTIRAEKTASYLLHGLDGDAAVRSTLELKRCFEKPDDTSRFQEDGTYEFLNGVDHAPPYFNITEDWNIDEFDSALGDPPSMPFEVKPAPNTTEMITLLWNPLPYDLPKGNKDILILMAAYNKDIDLYSRLRRPGVSPAAESNCIIRGIYHHPLFARWWAQKDISENKSYQKAITARFIMSNDVSRITPQTSSLDLPRLIWYPALAHSRTYEELARRRPDMHSAISRACIAANGMNLWHKLKMDLSDRDIWDAAIASHNPTFLEDLRRRAEASSTKVPRLLEGPDRAFTRPGLTEPSASILHPGIPSVDDVRWEQEGPYDGVLADASTVELWACFQKTEESVYSAVKIYSEWRYEAQPDVPMFQPEGPSPKRNTQAMNTSPQVAAGHGESQQSGVNCDQLIMLFHKLALQKLYAYIFVS